MSEQHIDYRDLTREKKLEVLDSLASVAVDIVIRHPDILEQSLVEVIVHRHEYGYVACLGLRHAIKLGRILAKNDGYGLNRILRVASADE